jgi:hypothetical protein
VHIVNDYIDNDEARVLCCLWFHCKNLSIDMMNKVCNQAFLEVCSYFEMDLCICFNWPIVNW